MQYITIHYHKKYFGSYIGVWNWGVPPAHAKGPPSPGGVLPLHTHQVTITIFFITIITDHSCYSGDKIIIRRTRVTFIVTKWQNVKYFRVDTDVTYSITGFRPNATKMTAHHMLVYGEQEQWKVGKEGQQIRMLVLSIQVVRSREPRPLLGIAERWPSRSRASAQHSLVQRWGPWWWWLSELPSSMLP